MNQGTWVFAGDMFSEARKWGFSGNVVVLKMASDRQRRRLWLGDVDGWLLLNARRYSLHLRLKFGFQPKPPGDDAADQSICALLRLAFGRSLTRS